MDEAKRKRLDQAPWEGIIEDLIHYTTWLVRMCYLAPHTPIGATRREDVVKDLVYDAVLKVFTGTRNWDPEQEADLSRYLRSVINSDFSHIFESADYMKSIRYHSSESDDKAEKGIHEDQMAAKALQVGLTGFPRPWTPPTPLQELEADQFLCKAIDAVKEDPQAVKVLELIMEEELDSREIAERTGIPIDEVYNINKRLKRKIKRLF